MDIELPVAADADLLERSGAPLTVEPCAFVASLASNKLQAFAGTVDAATGEYLDDPYAQNKSLSEHVAADYHGRFLLELIQNGADAHPKGRCDGEIEAVLADEGKFGVIYVANRGSPFCERRVGALSRIGKSSKPPGEAIGNKGLGFRSVSHVCDAPEIYSQAEGLGAARFEGFCFALEHGSALDGYFEDPRVRALARNDLPMFYIPRWLPEQPFRVLGFAERGFASVVRLVLRDGDARRDAVEQFRVLSSQAAPTLLFLERLGRLRIEVEGVDAAEPIVLERRKTALPGLVPPSSVVDLGSQGLFLVPKARVPEAAMKAAVDAGVAAKQLHSSWSAWSGEGEVALAVRLDDGPVAPRLYTFLPMGEGAAAPFHGYLHGSFFPTSNRKAIDPGVAINRVLLHEAVALAAKAVRWLAASGPLSAHTALNDEARARAAADLLVWTQVASLAGDEADDAAQRGEDALNLSSEVARLSAPKGGVFADAEVVPCLGPGAGGSRPVLWRAPGGARAWNDTLESFGVACLADHGTGIAPLLPGLGKARARRLVAFLRIHARGAFLETPTAAERARVAAALAASLPRGRRAPAAPWTAFYRDLPAFMEGASGALLGHEIILCGDHSLRAGRAAGTRDGETSVQPRRRRRSGQKVEASVFFPPAPRSSAGQEEREDDEVLKVPRLLEDYFAFASAALPWHGDLKRAREFLEGGVVAAYDGETVLTRISQVVNGGASVEETIAGLRWAFAIWRRAGQRLVGGQRTIRLLLPTAEQGLISASEAVFSETWPEETQGKRLKQFLDAAPAEAADIADLRARRIAPVTHRAFRRVRIAEWVEFLSALGVERGLAPVEKQPPRQFMAWELTTFAFCQLVGIPPAAAAVWKADVESAGGGFAYSTRYAFKGSLWWLPGQADHASFSDECRELYAALVVDWLDRAPDAAFSVRLTHSYYTADTWVWPTPAASFLRAAEWMPADDPRAGTEAVRGHFRPRDVWTAAPGERFPYYLRQPAVALSKAIERAGETARARLVDHARLRVLNRPATLLEQARFLAAQFHSGAVSRYYEPQFLNLYNGAWKGVADRHALEPAAFANVSPPALLVVRRGGEVAAVAPGASGAPPVYVRDLDDEIAVGLVQASGGALLDVKGADRKRVGAVLKALYDGRVRFLSELRYDVRADGVQIDELPRGGSAVDVCPWLRPMTAIAVEALRGAEAGQLPADRSVILTKLGAVELRFATGLVFQLDGATLAPDVRRRAHLFRRADGAPLVVALHGGPPGWREIEDCLRAICDAIDVPQLTASMRLLARELAHAGADPGAAEQTAADLDRLSGSLELDDQAVAAARQLLGDRLDDRLAWVRAIVHLYGGPDALHAFERGVSETGAEPNALRGLLGLLLPSRGIAGDEVIDACRRSFTCEDFRERLGIELAAFNASLARTGAQLETYPQLHAAQLLEYVTDHEVELILALRNAVAPKLERREPAPEYVRLRGELRSVAPDPNWLCLFKAVPEHLLAERVAAWLATAGAPPLGTNPNALPALQVVRTANLSAATAFAAAAAPLVRTWCARRGLAASEAWREPGASDAKLRTALEAVGVLDFRPLDQDGLLAWSAALGLWPKDMTQTLDRERLGIQATDVEQAEARAREDVEKQEARDRSVCFDGKDQDPKTTDWTWISEVIAAKLPKAVKATALSAQADLLPVVTRDEGAERRPPRRSRGEPGANVPQAKKDMIGRLGELVVYHWLKARFPNQDIDAAWISEIGDHQLGRRDGSDDEGFDFRVDYNRQTWQLEVKSSMGDQQIFKMGETQVRAARDAARGRSKVRYAIVYVADPHEPSRCRIDVLPNPMSEEADGVLELLGEGVRFGFRRH